MRIPLATRYIALLLITSLLSFACQSTHGKTARQPGLATLQEPQGYDVSSMDGAAIPSRRREIFVQPGLHTIALKRRPASSLGNAGRQTALGVAPECSGVIKLANDDDYRLKVYVDEHELRPPGPIAGTWHRMTSRAEVVQTTTGEVVSRLNCTGACRVHGKIGANESSVSCDRYTVYEWIKDYCWQQHPKRPTACERRIHESLRDIQLADRSIVYFVPKEGLRISERNAERATRTCLKNQGGPQFLICMQNQGYEQIERSDLKDISEYIVE